MNGIIWLWKHRHCWEQLKYLYEHRSDISRSLSFHPDRSEREQEILAALREFDRVPLTRQIPRRPLCNERIERALVLPTGGGESAFSDRLDPAKEKIDPWNAYVNKVEAILKIATTLPRWAIDAGSD